jgi:hypothetical protein
MFEGLREEGGEISHQFPTRLRPPQAAKQRSPSYDAACGDINGICHLVLRPEDKIRSEILSPFLPGREVAGHGTFSQ